MRVFILIHRRNFNGKLSISPKLFQNSIREWQNWYGSIAAQNKLIRPLEFWDPVGIVVVDHYDFISGPYAEINESIGGVIFIYAVNYDEALEIARECPVLKFGGSVEVRMWL